MIKIRFWFSFFGAIIAGFMICFLSGCNPDNEEKKTAARLKPLRIVTFGDSITLGIKHGVTPRQTFTYYLGKYLEAKGLTVEMIRKGVSGETTERAKKRLEWDVIPLQPDFCLIMYGTNDAFIDVHIDKNDTSSRVSLEQYEKNLHAMVRRLKENRIKPVLMTPIPMGMFSWLEAGIYKNKDANFRLKEYARIVRRIARNEKILLVDHFNIWLQWKKHGLDLNTLYNDGLHPNRTGHKKIAKAIFHQLIKQIRIKHIKT